MKKKDVVKSNILFNDIIQKGKKVSNKYFVVCSLPNEYKKLFGIAVGKKVGNAVTRNKVKRQIRHLVDINYEIFPDKQNYIIICKKEVLDLTFEKMNLKLRELFIKGENNAK